MKCCLSAFFFKQKTAYEIRPRDWSSDVCSSDLPAATRRARWKSLEAGGKSRAATCMPDRKSGVEGKRVDLGGRRIIKKKKKKDRTLKKRALIDEKMFWTSWNSTGRR